LQRSHVTLESRKAILECQQQRFAGHGAVAESFLSGDQLPLLLDDPAAGIDVASPARRTNGVT
jgi:hypothetical protein